MDRAYIESHAVMQQYLAGTLSDEESRAFEDACAADATLIDELNRDLHLKAGMARLAERGELAALTRRRQMIAYPRYAAAASIAAAVALGTTAYLGWRAYEQQQTISQLEKRLAAPVVLGHVERIIRLRGEQIDVPLPAQGWLGLSVDATAFAGLDVEIELKDGAGETLLRQSHHVGDDGTVFIVVDPASVPPGDYIANVIPRVASPSSPTLSYRLRTIRSAAPAP